jgi:HTH-type transcriptional regulator / antitoxin HigA
MISSLKILNHYYMQIITNEQELIATRNQINSILDQRNITQDDRDYLKILGTLVYDYEQQHEIIPTLKGIPLLQALLEESNLQPKDLISILQSESIVLDILNGKRQLTANQIQDLAVFFQIDPTYLVA